jgi:hypothetical protein
MHALRISGTDSFAPSEDLYSDDGGKTWTGPRQQRAAFARRPMPGGVEEGVSDFWPTWHAQTGVLLATSHTIRYINDDLEPNPRPRSTAYSTYDPERGAWAPFQKLATPDDDLFFMEGAGSTQRVDLPNGEILLPTYTAVRETSRGIFNSEYIALVMRCGFDGETLTYLEHGDRIGTTRGSDFSTGFCEPSLVRYQDRFFVSLRNDEHNQVATGPDGLHFDEPRKFTFDDGTDVGTYATQTHWAVVGDGLYLVYTRKREDNGHILWHRAPLYIARFEPERLCIVRETEQELVPNRGARLGNSGVTQFDNGEAWVTVTEWMQTHPPDHHDCTVCEKYGSDNSIYLVRLRPS